MKKIFYLMIGLATFTVSAQVGVGVSSANVDASAQFEVSSTNKGFLAPRMSEAQKNDIASPAAGLLVYQTDGTTGFYYYDGLAWKSGLGAQGLKGDKGENGTAGQTNTSLLYPSASIYADGAAPTDAPSTVTSTYGNFGWYFKKTGNSKINWYIQPKSSSMKVSDLTGLYLELFNVAIASASNMPFITVYTKVDANSPNAASWYKSKRSYIFSDTPVTNTKYLGFLNFGANSPNSYNNNLLNLAVENFLSRGDYAQTEDILMISINTNSTASNCEFVANKLGVISGSGTQEFLFMPPSSIANLSSYATTAALTQLETQVSMSTSDISNLSSSLNTETVRAQNAETTLNNAISDNKALTDSAIQNLTSALDAETSRAQNTDETLRTSLQDLMAAGTQGPQGPEGVQGEKGERGEQGPAGTPADLSGYATTDALTQLETQVAMSTSDISNLSSSLNTETVRAQNAEVTLTNSINEKAPLNAPSFTGTATASGFKTPAGTSTQYLMADGSVRDASVQAAIIATMQAEIALLKTQVASLLSSNEPPAVSLAIGDTYQGGKVAYILQAGDPGYDANVQHGFVIATASIGNKSLTDWGNYVNGTSINFGTGMSNTNLIAQANLSYDGAAQLALNYTVGQYSDWYLPSVEEGGKIRPNLNMLGFNAYITCMGSSMKSEQYSFSEWEPPMVYYLNYVLAGEGYGGNNNEFYWNVGETKDVLPIHTF